MNRVGSLERPFEPVNRLDVPVVQENFKTSGKLEKTVSHQSCWDSEALTVNSTLVSPDLDVQDPQVGDEVPARSTVIVVAVKTKTCGVVDGISCRMKVSLIKTHCGTE